MAEKRSSTEDPDAAASAAATVSADPQPSTSPAAPAAAAPQPPQLQRQMSHSPPPLAPPPTPAKGPMLATFHNLNTALNSTTGNNRSSPSSPSSASPSSHSHPLPPAPPPRNEPTATTPTTSPQAQSPTLTVRIQLFPHSDRPAHLADGSRAAANAYTAFSFTPVEKDLFPGSIVRIGRKVDRHSNGLSRAATRSRRDRSHNVASGAEDMEFDPDSPVIATFVNGAGGGAGSGVGGTPGSGAPSTPASSAKTFITRRADYVAFRSKVVSRNHAEIWVDRDGVVFFRDVGSSSGTFLNRLRLSPSGKESPPYVLKNGDVVQLGVDYQGRVEEIYKCVMFKIFVTVKVGGPSRRLDPHRLRSAVSNLISAMNPTAGPHDLPTSECCICLNSLSPFQSLFLAPCSHCFHYKCVTPLLSSNVMFLCPMCRQVTNLDAAIAEDEDAWVDHANDINARADARGSSRPASIRSVRKDDVEKRVKMILEEAERPLPRVTASDLDALLSDGEHDSTGAALTVNASVTGSAQPPQPPQQQQQQPLAPASLASTFVNSLQSDQWNTATLVRPARTHPTPTQRRAMEDAANATASLPQDAAGGVPVAPTAAASSAAGASASPIASSPELSSGSSFLQRHKTSVNRRTPRPGTPPPPLPPGSAAIIAAAAPAAAQLDQGDENARLRALLADMAPYLPTQKQAQLAKDLEVALSLPAQANEKGKRPV
ncbi:hypothetical protein HDU87_008828 [Geranomyces variabilis]|uniref:Uncharacterized protein n=1 Tax=Geranomyces variabilis TaxID=109894 RepID=A0AAD5TEQ9_9FUNG|nr:hypothetical protein HDU87_008828 [Geranomyces variabilis]